MTIRRALTWALTTLAAWLDRADTTAADRINRPEDNQ